MLNALVVSIVNIFMGLSKRNTIYEKRNPKGIMEKDRNYGMYVAANYQKARSTRSFGDDFRNLGHHERNMPA